MTWKEEKRLLGGANIETFIQQVKNIPLYGAYKHAVESMEDKETDKFLQITAMFYASTNSEFGLMMNSVALDFLFAFVDQKLRMEILESKESED